MPRTSWSRWAVSVLLALVAAGGLTTGTTAAAPSSAAPTDPMAAVAAMQPGWNLGNTLDAIPDETSWGNPPATKALFDTIRSQGFHSVRIPVTWSGHASATAPYTIDPTFLARVKQVVDWALADGLYAEINVHHDSWQWIADMTTRHDQVLDRFNATWRQIAAAFRDEPAGLLFESVNEPQFNTATDAQKTQFMNELNTSFHTIVRQSGGRNTTRLLVLPTLGCTPDQKLMDDLAATISSLHDRYLVATVHYYGYWPFSVNIAGGTRFDAQVRKDMTDAFARMRDTFVSKGIPVYLGEYGLLSEPTAQNVERGEMLKYYEELGYQARINGVTGALWDDANFLNRDTMQWRDPELIALIKSSWCTRSGTASSDLVFVSNSVPIGDQKLSLNLNGVAFRGLWQGNTRLVERRDYTVAGDQLTLTAAALTRLAGNRAYGVNATIEARFSTGVPWPLKVITNDVPALAGSTGAANSFTIPTQFRGDVLATMESRYADGTNAGPANWTPYQGFGSAYAPDYAHGDIALTAEFFTAVTDGAPVTLTFHFWSGATVTYHVTRSGSSVIGS